MTQRQSQILHMIAKDGKIDVSTLAETLDVSLVTIRRDLTVLEESGLIKRQHGYAELNVRSDINNRLALHYEKKLDIARRACQIIEDGEVILLESGSCCALLAEQINQTLKNVTIITYSAYIANHLALTNGNQIILLGGNVLSESKNTVGPLTIDTLKNFSVDKLFSGTDGLTPNCDFTAKDIMIAQVVSVMSQRARRTYVLTDSSKFSKQGTVVCFPASQVTTVFTDSDCPESVIRFLEEHEINVDTGNLVSDTNRN